VPLFDFWVDNFPFKKIHYLNLEERGEISLSGIDIGLITYQLNTNAFGYFTGEVIEQQLLVSASPSSDLDYFSNVSLSTPDSLIRNVINDNNSLTWFSHISGVTSLEKLGEASGVTTGHENHFYIFYKQTI